jgi:4-hydroxy-tetrahydrodipicolinate synthase
LKLGGVGLIPSGAHLIPNLYQLMYEAAMADQWDRVDELQSHAESAVAMYLKGRSIGQGLAKLKLMLEERGICGRTMLSPLLDE